MNKTFVGLYT